MLVPVLLTTLTIPWVLTQVDREMMFAPSILRAAQPSFLLLAVDSVAFFPP